ncbi:unnamed protein product [Paramecium primaurelia]|uniref:Uncharacterized protein n=1 Tax=Paramecium primaurelia TaxID=5886 RepID=A0A8S1QNL9_PARPR|nr:unnamed protein product [Paramecium primaurelia]
MISLYYQTQKSITVSGIQLPHHFQQPLDMNYAQYIIPQQIYFKLEVLDYQIVIASIYIVQLKNHLQVSIQFNMIAQMFLQRQLLKNWINDNVQHSFTIDIDPQEYNSVLSLFYFYYSLYRQYQNYVADLYGKIFEKT